MIPIQSSYRRRRRQFLLSIVSLLVLAVPVHQSAAAGRTSATPALCTALNAPKDLHKTGATTLTTIEQGYRCLLKHYVTGKRLDDRVLLRGAYNGLVSQLRQIGLPLPGAVLPPLSGDREADWQIFSRAYTSLVNGLPHLGFVGGALAQEALAQMTLALKDDHTGYYPAEIMQPFIAQLSDSGRIPSVGLVTSSPTAGPLFITDVFPGSPASDAGLRPGDTITAVGGSTLKNGQVSASLLGLLFPTIGAPVQMTVLRPQTGATLSVTLQPRNLVPPDISARLVAGNIAFVRLYQFTKHAAKEVLGAITGFGPMVRGVVLDLRGNPGGYADQAVQILSAFTHHRVLEVSVDGSGKRDPQRTDDRLPLLHQPLAVLIDQGSGSSSEIVAGAVRDYTLGRLVGQRTGGALAGAEFYGLSDGSGMEVTEAYILGPKGERIDGVGVAPDDAVTTTAGELSAGHDPALDQAVRFLRSQVATAG